MFGKRKNVVSLANRTRKQKPPSALVDSMVLLGVCFAFGVLGWYLVRPLIG